MIKKWIIRLCLFIKYFIGKKYLLTFAPLNYNVLNLHLSSFLISLGNHREWATASTTCKTEKRKIRKWHIEKWRPKRNQGRRIIIYISFWHSNLLCDILIHIIIIYNSFFSSPIILLPFRSLNIDIVLKLNIILCRLLWILLDEILSLGKKLFCLEIEFLYILFFRSS